MKKLIGIIKRDLIYTAFLGLLIVLVIIYPQYIKSYPSFIHWKTIATITGLIVTTTGIEQSAVLDTLTIRLIKHSKNELGLTVRLAMLTLLFSAFITNDISLFIVIPITLHIQKFIKNDIKNHCFRGDKREYQLCTYSNWKSTEYLSVPQMGVNHFFVYKRNASTVLSSHWNSASLYSNIF